MARKFPDPGEWMATIKEHWSLALVLCLAAFALFTSLGREYFWADEGDTAVLALNVKKYGVPKAWDGVTFIDSDMGQRENSNLVMISHPWVQYYIAAAGMLLFGETTWAARLPFALAGWLTILAVYVVSFRQTSDKRSALSAAILLSLSLQFLLFSRQCRNYALTMLLTCLLLLAFFRLKDRKSAFHFAIVSILLFHSHPSAVAPLGTLGLLTLIGKPFRDYRKWFWLAAPLIALCTIPWFFAAKTGYEQNTTALTISEIPARLTQFFYEWASATPVIGAIMLFLIVWFRHCRENKTAPAAKTKKNSIPPSQQPSPRLFQIGEYRLIITVGFILAAYAALAVVTQSRGELWQLGVRQVVATIPLMAILTGALVSKLSRADVKLWMIVLVLLSATQLGQITPWSFLHEGRLVANDASFANMHIAKGWANKLFQTGLPAFLKDLWRDNPGTDRQVCQFLQTNAAPDDILITNYAWEPLYFHTRLPQGLKILPQYPIYQTARKHGLPEYVFTVERARWVVWRHSWEGYQGYEFETLQNTLTSRGATLEQVALLPETIWENRENIHFRRFAGNDYKYVWMDNPAPTEIFRVHWPEQNTASP